MIANAGIIHNYVKTWQIDEADFRNVIDVNVIGVWHTIKAAVPTLIEQGSGGSISSSPDLAHLSPAFQISPGTSRPSMQCSA